MSKSCGFLGNDYKDIIKSFTPPNLKERLREQIINLIENEDVDTFYVGEKGGYELDAYDTILEIQKEYKDIYIHFVIASERELNKFEADGHYISHQRGFDGFIYPAKAELGYKRWCIVHRNNWIISNSDFIISYNKRKGRAYEFCKKAKNKGVNVIELTEIYDFSS